MKDRARRREREEGREAEVRRQWKIERMKDLTLELVRQHAA